MIFISGNRADRICLVCLFPSVLDKEFFMANSLLPDLGADQSKKESNIIVEFDYDNTNAEVDGAMKTFQYKFSSKRGLLAIVAYSLLLVAAVVMIIINPTMYLLYAALLVILGGLFLAVTAKKRMRKKVIQALDSLPPETYHCRVFPDKVEIETIIRPKENLNSDESDESKSEPEPVMSVYDFSKGFLDFAENSDSYLLVVAGKQFHCFPKRCLTDEQREIFKNTLIDKTSSF